MPTGGGKSLCYQLPSLLLPGVTLVVSPLIALMKDQVDALVARGLPATFVNSSLSGGERAKRLARAVEGRYRLLYVTPERFRSPAFREVLERWRPDVVHSHLLHTHLSYGCLTDANRFGAGVVFTAHDVMTFCYQKLTCFHGGEAHGGELRDYPAHWSKCIPCQRLRYRPGRNGAIRKVLERDVDRFTVVSDELGRAISANGIRVDRTVHNAIRQQPRLPGEAEVAAFRGMARLIDESPDVVILTEFFPEGLAAAGSSAEEFLALLRGHGLTIETLEGTPVDDATILSTIPDCGYTNLVARRS